MLIITINLLTTPSYFTQNNNNNNNKFKPIIMTLFFQEKKKRKRKSHQEIKFQRKCIECGEAKRNEERTEQWRCQLYPISFEEKKKQW